MSMHRFIPFTLLLVLAFLPRDLVAETATQASATQASAITVSNHQHDSTVRYSVVLLRGEIPADAKSLTIQNDNTPKFAGDVRAVVRNGRFKALVQLSEGENQLRLTADGSKESTGLVINFKPSTNPHYVRLVWMTDSAGDTDFAVPSSDVPQDYEARLRTAALLMQTFTADRMDSLGYGKRTFRLERDSEGQVVVHTWKGSETKADYYAKGDSGRWWNNVRNWLNREHPDPMAKNVVLAAYTRKDPRTGKMLGHTALGGANLGLFGSASVFSWPRSIETAADAFLDEGTYDVTKVHDDSVGRSNIWGLASTTIGATLHETGHTFGLPHCRDNFGIMRRGFDHFNRCFTIHDPPSGRSRKAYEFRRKEEAYFAPESASALRWSPWLEPDKPKLADRKLKIVIDSDAKTVVITCPDGVAWFGLHAKGDIRGFREHDPDSLPKEVTLTLKEMTGLCSGTKPDGLRVLSGKGVAAYRDLKKM